MASVMIVDADQLPNTPKAFQEYVATYFTETRILGHRVMVAVRKTCGDGYGRGCAPSHSIDLSRFKEGVEGEDPRKGSLLGAWIDRHKGILLWELAGGYDSDNVVYDD